MKTLYLDIETSPSMAWVWSTGKQYISHNQILEDTRIICIAYKWEGAKEKCKLLTWDKKKDDKHMLIQLGKVIEQADVVIAHNGKGFDVKHINARLAFHSLPPMSIITISDSLLLSRQKFKLASHSLAYLAKYFHVGAKMETGGIELWLAIWMHGDVKAMKKMGKYCMNDVTLLEKVYARLKPYLDTKTNLSTDKEDARICPSCAGKLIKHSIRQTSAVRKVQVYKCKKCLKHIRSGINLLANTSQYPR